MVSVARVTSPVTGLAIILAGCQSSEVTVTAKPAPTTMSSYAQKLDGKFLLFIDATKLQKTFRPQSANCSAYSIPIDARNAFSETILRTFQSSVGTIELVASPPTKGSVAGAGADGGIIVSAETLEAQFRLVPSVGLFNGVEVETEMTAYVAVDGRGGRIFGATIDADGTSSGPAGPTCGEGGTRLAESAADTVRTISGKIVEAVTNSDRVRSGFQ